VRFPIAFWAANGGPGGCIRVTRLENKNLMCKDCGNSFEFTVRDQQFYAEKGFENEPQRCRDCRSARKTQRASGNGHGAEREMFDTICAQCSTATTVPFKPRGDRPVYCRSCFTAMNSAVAAL
jgi:CxxC-x17-CxxC domain-containing protein